MHLYYVLRQVGEGLFRFCMKFKFFGTMYAFFNYFNMVCMMYAARMYKNWVCKIYATRGGPLVLIGQPNPWRQF